MKKEHEKSMMENYFEDGYAFLVHTAAGEKKGTVILLHGWGVRAASMEQLAELLTNHGYDVLNYDYPTSKKNIAGHAEKFLSLYRTQKIEGNEYFLTHSMGGLVLRRAMADMTEAECRRISSVVMLGPPNQGSGLAYFGKGPVRLFNASLGDMVPGSETLKIRPPVYLPPVGIIAAERDEKVAFERTGLPDDLPFQRVTVACNHPGLRNPKNTGRKILRFLREQKF